MSCILEPAQPSKNCPRANGFFPFPSEESCQKFWDCREGRSYLQVYKKNKLKAFLTEHVVLRRFPDMPSRRYLRQPRGRLRDAGSGGQEGLHRHHVPRLRVSHLRTRGVRQTFLFLRMNAAFIWFLYFLSVLRFGNHDRLPDPKDCQQFFSCLKTGEPRLGACPRWGKHREILIMYFEGLRP